MKISYGIIAWNEATTIDLTLKSIVGFADEVIIVDTGSFDDTKKIAEEWLQKLDLSGQVISLTITRICQARYYAMMQGEYDWITLHDANVVLSEMVKRELHDLATKEPDTVIHMKSLNLIGDFKHYYQIRPFMAPHAAFVRRELMLSSLPRYVQQDPMRCSTIDRPKYFDNSQIRFTDSYAINLSRVRPAWRVWYRGEPFPNPTKSRQRLWLLANKYNSIADYVEAEEGLSYEDVQRLAPRWYLNLLRKTAEPITTDMRNNIPDVIKDEWMSPRFEILKENDVIVGRKPYL